MKPVLLALALLAFGTTLCLFFTTKMLSWNLHLPAEKIASEALYLPATPATPRVLVVCLARTHSGCAVSVFNHYHQLVKHGIPALLLTAPGSILVDMARAAELPVATCSPFKLAHKEYVWQPGLERCLKKLLARFGFTILHVNGSNEVYAAAHAVHSTRSNCKVVFTHHMPDPLLRPKALKACSGIIGVSEQTTKTIRTCVAAAGATQTKTTTVTPFFNEDKFLNYRYPRKPRAATLKRLFGIELKDCPLLSKTAHFYQNLKHKNHPLLLRAMRLLHDEGRPVQAILAGQGPRLEYCQQLAQKLGLAEYVHFVGKTDDTPAILAAADINLLASSEEAFGIALAEGGLMAKPSLAARGTGAADLLIQDGQTGLLFNNDDAADLARAIKQLLDDPDRARQLGQALHDRVMAHFSSAALVNKLLAFYQELS